MTTVTDIAQRMLAENNWTTDDITLLNTEYLIKNAVDYINLMAGTSISFTPSAGSENLVASDNEIVVVKFATTLLLRAYLDRGPNVSVGGLSLSSVISDPQYAFYAPQLTLMVEKLSQRDVDIPFMVAEDTSGIE